jgi:putative transposase
MLDHVEESRSGSAPRVALTRAGQFTASFDNVLTGSGIQIIKTPPRSPRANAFAERYVGTLRRECLAHVLIYGERHLRSLLKQFGHHYNDHRPHRARLLHPPTHDPATVIDMTTAIQRRKTVDGLINECWRAA